MDLVSVMFLACFTIVCLIVLLRSVKLVRPGEVFVVERLGKFDRTLTPGLHLLVPIVDHVRGRLPLTEQAIAIGDEPVIARDGLLLRADLRITVVVEDPAKAATEVDDLVTAVRTAAVHHLRDGVGSIEPDEALERSSSLIADLRMHLGPLLRGWGLRLVAVDGAISRRAG